MFGQLILQLTIFQKLLRIIKNYWVTHNKTHWTHWTYKHLLLAWIC